jgi:hypothetical protein
MSDAEWRDWFAGTLDLKDFQFGGIESAEEFLGEPRPAAVVEQMAWGLRLMAKLRYTYADAMMAERSKR